MLSKTLCILFAGKAGVGKSLSATYSKEYLSTKYGLIGDIFPFARGVKECAKNYFGWDGVKDARGRALLQNVGRIGREYNVDIWVKKAVDSFYASSPIPIDFMLVDDWRFENERNYVLAEKIFNVITVRIESPSRELLTGTPAARDSSEISLQSALPLTKAGLSEANFGYKYIIGNTSTKEDLYVALETLLDREVNALTVKTKKKGE